MKTTQYNLGADVVCQNRECGKVARLVADPHTHRITDLIVQQGRLFKKDTVVPVDAVAEATPERITLNLDDKDLQELDAYRGKEYVAPPEGWDKDRPKEASPFVHRVWPSAMVAPRMPVVPMVVHRVREGVSPDDIVLERGMKVQGTDDEIGTLDHVRVNAESGDIQLLIVDRGLLKDEVVIPAESVKDITKEAINVDLSTDQVDDLVRYKPRATIDVMAEIKDRLATLAVDEDSLDIQLTDGILTLEGVVPNMRLKRRVEAACRSVEGVFDVNDALRTAKGIEASVVAALESNSVTDLAGIDVIARGGTVTLTGKVDREEIKQKAGELAESQPGVLQVVNDIEVDADEDTPLLQARWLAITRAHNPAVNPGDMMPG